MLTDLLSGPKVLKPATADLASVIMAVLPLVALLDPQA